MYVIVMNNPVSNNIYYSNPIHVNFIQSLIRTRCKMHVKQNFPLRRKIVYAQVLFIGKDKRRRAMNISAWTDRQTEYCTVQKILETTSRV